MARAILLCGTQASGKSTYAASLDIAVHSRDEVRARLRSEDPTVTEDIIWNTVLEEMATTLRSGRDAVLDSTLVNPRRRDEAVKFFGTIAGRVEIHHIRTPLAQCHQWNNRRPAATRVYPPDIDQTYRQIQEAFALNPPRCRVVGISSGV